MSSRAKAYLALLTVALIWGIALPLVKPSLEFVSPYQFLYFRYLIAAPLLLPVLISYAFKLKLSLKTYLKIIALEILGTPVALPILYQGLKLTSGLEASLLGATGPIFTILGGIIFLNERESKREWRGLFLSFLGWLIRGLWQKIKISLADQENKIYYSTLLSLVCGVILFQFFNTGYWQAVMWLPLGVALVGQTLDSGK